MASSTRLSLIFPLLIINESYCRPSPTGVERSELNQRKVKNGNQDILKYVLAPEPVSSLYFLNLAA